MLTGKSFVVVLLVTLFAFANISVAKTTYTAANVKGSYSVLLNKWDVSTGAEEAAVLGVLNFDGVSAVSGSLTSIDDGTLSFVTVSDSTYTVNPSGSGSMTLNLTGGGSFQIGYVLNSVSTSIARSLQLLQINNPSSMTIVYAGSASSTDLSGSATAAKLKGTYSLLLDWWTTGTQQALIGTVVFDGKSKVTLSFTDQQGGSPATTGAGSGTYSVNSDGSGSMNLTLSTGAPLQLDFVLNSIKGSVARGLQLLDVTSPSVSSVDTGTAVFE